ncbi:fructosamine kinase family protein [uncultured Gordonia sp.]|uniref:fructosamine kinase family protein n=1 Tax=uncultured Gordonia sp. TaxID=198437 RepID=UPI002583A9A3|nr:fructosamine kinase family protein [uncultured Gordonia sp.]
MPRESDNSLDENVFRKTRRDADPDFFAAEAAGLRWLAEAGAPVVDVIAVWDSGIELQRLDSAFPDADAAREFGAALARMHDAGADSFGAPPAGYHGRQFIGERPLSSRTHASWGAFYAAERVEPYLEPARRAGYLTADDEELTRSACAAIADGVFDDDESPSRLHGDLWSGNVMWTPDGVVMIDPAAHGGHRETDLAMLALFGCPQLDAIVSAYDQTHPLAAGWRDRIPLHQLHPLAVHAAGHGPSYGSALGRAAQATLALTR